MTDVGTVASEDAVFAVTVAVGSVTPPTVEGGRVWFANETAWIDQLEFASGCAGVASAVAAGLIDDAVDVVSAYEKGPIRDAVASGVVAILAQAELWSAEMPVIDALQELTRRFIAGIRDRELLTRPRIVLEHEEKDV